MIKHTMQDPKNPKNPKMMEVLENAILCDSYKSTMQDMHKLTNHCNQEQEKMKKP